jgi:hypothetical protein
MLWRAIGIGSVFGLIGLVMMALTIGAAGVAPSAPDATASGPVVTHVAPTHRLEIYQDPTEAFGAALPVP